MDLSTIGVAQVVAITAICYLLAMAFKAWGKHDNWIPVFCGVLGGALGVLGMYVIPDFPAQDIITAIAVGIMSGLAATGINQAYKQLKVGDT